MFRLLVSLLLVNYSHQSSLLELREDLDTRNIAACQGSDILSCTVADVNPASLEDVGLLVPECGQLGIKNILPPSSTRSSETERSSSFSFENMNGCNSVFTTRNGKVIGSLTSGAGRKFHLEPCDAHAGCHVWKEIDVTHFEEAEGVPVPDNERIIFSEEEIEELERQGKTDDETIVFYSVKIYYTIEFAQHTSDIELYVDQVLAETNQGYINSFIPTRMQLHSLEAAELNDVDDTSAMLTAFRYYKNSVEELRGGADAAALLLNQFDACGRGYVDSWRSGLTLTVQKKSCALGYYTMGHEIGHNFGCAHDREHASTSAYDYGFGAYIGDGPYRTILAYSKTGYKTRVNVYSSPEVEYQGVITGSSSEDNARVITENRYAMAAVGDD